MGIVPALLWGTRDTPKIKNHWQAILDNSSVPSIFLIHKGGEIVLLLEPTASMEFYKQQEALVAKFGIGYGSEQTSHGRNNRLRRIKLANASFL